MWVTGVNVYIGTIVFRPVSDVKTASITFQLYFMCFIIHHPLLTWATIAGPYLNTMSIIILKVQPRPPHDYICRILCINEYLI